MEKFKICPCCGARNSPQSFECSECETDITAIPAVDEDVLNAKDEPQPEAEPAYSKRVRICSECGEKNAPNARVCSACGEDISDICPTEDINTPAFLLKSADGEYAYSVKEGEYTIGRECTMDDYLRQKPFVSRTHAKLIRRGNHLWIVNLSHTNYTYVNDEKIPDGEFELHQGDIIGLGGKQSKGTNQDNAAFFTVEISSCT